MDDFFRAITRKGLQAAAIATMGVFSLATTMAASAEDYIDPNLVKVSTPIYKLATNDFDPEMGKYTYSVSWEGIPAADVEVAIDQADGNVQVVANARTLSAIDIFYKMRYRAEGVLSSYDLSPIKLDIDHIENSKHKLINMNFADDGEISTVRQRSDGSDRKELNFASHNFTLDPIGAAFLARSLEWKVGDTKIFDVFNGKSRYLISLHCNEKTTIDFKGQQREVFAITPKVRNLTTTKPVDKLRDATIYMTTDNNRDILKLVSDVFIGSVTTELESFVPSNKPENRLRLAHRAAPYTDSIAR